MKRTERMGFALTKEENAEIILESARLHISKSAYVRMRIFAERVQYIPQKRRLPSIPGTPMDMTKNNMVNVIVELKGVLVTRKKIIDNYEEKLADEVGIK